LEANATPTSHKQNVQFLLNSNTELDKTGLKMVEHWNFLQQFRNKTSDEWPNPSSTHVRLVKKRIRH